MNLSRDLDTRPAAPARTFIPPWLTARIEGVDESDLDEHLRERRRKSLPDDAPTRTVGSMGEVAWTVHDAANSTQLPGTAVRRAGEEGSGDLAVDEAASGIQATIAMFYDDLGRSSYDDAGAPVSLTVHYGSSYDNAFWDGTQLVFGDGDGRIFERFTKPVDVLAHEFAHAVIQHTADLTYSGQSGALNESLADVFASCLKQRVLRQDAASGDWLIGEGIFTSAVRARALRDMAVPGTAFDDEMLGRDPQVGHMDDYVDTTSDNGGVHLNSGIPNRAFHRAAIAIGGASIDGAGRIWYAALTEGRLAPDADFADFAAATIAVAGPHAEVVRRAWDQVGVSDPAAPGSRPDVPLGDPPGAPRLLRVRRTGGFAGITTSRQVDLSSDGPGGEKVRELLARADLAVGDEAPLPDMFVYEFQIDDAPPVRVPQQHLSGGLSALAHAVLGDAIGEDV